MLTAIGGQPPGGTVVESRAALIAELLERHAAALQWYASQWTTSAEDCVQESLIELARQETLPDNPVAWLYRVVRHRALNIARSERRRRGHEETASILATARRHEQHDHVRRSRTGAGRRLDTAS